MTAVTARGRVIETRADLFVLRDGTREITHEDPSHDVELGQIVELLDDGTYSIVGKAPDPPTDIPVTGEGADMLDPPAGADGVPDPRIQEMVERRQESLQDRDLALANHLVAAMEQLVGGMTHLQQIMPQAAGLGPLITAARFHVQEARVLLTPPEIPAVQPSEPPTIEGITWDDEHTEGPQPADQSAAGLAAAASVAQAIADNAQADAQKARDAADKAADKAADVAEKKPDSPAAEKAADKADDAAAKAEVAEAHAAGAAKVAEAVAGQAEPQPDHS